MTKADVKQLLIRYKGRQCTAEEIAWVESWYLNLNKDVALNLTDADFFRAEQEMMMALNIESKRTMSLWSKISVAASVVLIFGLAFYLLGSNGFFENRKVVSSTSYASLPGGNKATLVLSDGKKVDLEESGYGELAELEDVSITKNKAGQLIYNAKSTQSPSTGPAAYHTVITPRAGTYQVILQDGSVVWLNAESSIRFPSAFSENERLVELHGEAYFEIAKDSSRPFKVRSGTQTIQVLGTKFNANTYQDEPAYLTTLLEGSVKISDQTNSVMMKPGQQVSNDGEKGFVVRNVDADHFMAWKDGVFSFNRTDLRSVMRQLARWYDFEVQYEKGAPELSFSGKIYRNLALNDALQNLVFLDVGFRIKGRTVTVLSKQ